MKHKSKTLEKFKEFKLQVENEIRQKIVCLRSDRGREYLSRDFLDFCVQHGIHRQLTMAHTP
jgi:transposase InsO family protein